MGKDPCAAQLHLCMSGMDTAEFALGPPVLDMSDKGEQDLFGPGSPS